MDRKLIRIGKALAVTLPARTVRQIGLREGERLTVFADIATGTIRIRPAIRYFENGKVTPRFRKLMNETLKRHGKAYRALAKH